MINERIYYIDVLKFIAIFGVIFIHVCGFTGHSEILHTPITHFSQLFVFAVPIFLMITGTLLLKRNITLSSFLKKRLSRVIFPYLFWIILAIITFLYISNSPVSDYPMVIADKFFNMSWNWYFWMILGVYFVIPIINEFIINKGIEGCKYFIALMISASIFYSVCSYLSYKTTFDLRYFIYPISFVVLGYFLANYEFKMPKNRLILISLIVFIIATGLKFVFFDAVILETTNESIFLNSFLDINILSILQSASLFLIFKNLNYRILNKSPVKRFITSVSRSSYGMYLSEIILLIPLSQIFKNYTATGTQCFFYLIAFTVLIFFLTWIFVLAVDRIPKLHKFSGYY